MINDVVLIQDSNVHRGQWTMGRVTKVFPGVDGWVRRCEVAYVVPSNDDDKCSPCKTFERPIHKLVVIVPADENLTTN